MFQPGSSDESDASQPPGFYDPYAGSNGGGKGSWGSHGSGTNKSECYDKKRAHTCTQTLDFTRKQSGSNSFLSDSL